MADSGTIIDALTSDSSKPLPRCIIPMLDALGWCGDISHLAAALPHMPETMGLSDFLNTFANLRFEGKVFKSQLQKIDHRLMPCMFVDKHGDAIILIKKTDDEALIFDGKNAEYRRTTLDDRKGQVVSFKILNTGADSPIKPQSDWFKKITKRFEKIFLLGAVITFLLTVLALLSPVFIMTLYGQAQSMGGEKTVLLLSIGIVLYVIFDAGFRFLRSNVFSFISVRLGNIIGTEVLRRILYLPPAYTETASLGAQVARIKDFETVREFFGGSALISLFELPFLIILMTALAILGGPIVFVPISAIVVFILFGLAVMPRMKTLNQKSAKTSSRRQTFMIETLSNLRAIKYTGAVKLWAERNKEVVADAAVHSFEVAKLNGLINAFSHALVQISGLLTMSFGVTLVMQGSMSGGALMASMILTWRILSPIKTGFGILTQLGRIRRSINQVNRLMNMQLEAKQDASLTAFARLKGQIAFSRVALRYSTSAPPALIGIDLNFAPGETVVVVGHDGAGKSSLLKLILGLYTPQAGRVMLDNVNVQQIDTVALRQAVGYSPSKSHFFYGTIAQNLRLSNFNASDKELEDATRRAFVYDDIMQLPEGFQTRIGDHNISQLPLSFRRRLSFARVFLRDPQIMLFDEPETGLSQVEVMTFMEEIANKDPEVTTVIATHNAELFEIADKVIWLENGRIRMIGSPEDVSIKYSDWAA